MISFKIINLTTNEELLVKPFDNYLIGVDNNQKLLEYASSMAKEVTELKITGPAAIKFYNDDEELVNTNNSFGLKIEEGITIGSEEDAMQFLLMGFFTFITVDGEKFIAAPIEEEEVFEPTDQELTKINNNDLIVLVKQTATNENWDVDSVKINNPINFEMLSSRGFFNIRSLYMRSLTNVKVVADYNDKTLVLANININPFDDNDYSLKLVSESGVYADLEGNKYFVPSKIYNELTNFRLKIDDEKYQALNKIETQWVVNFRKGGKSDQTEVKKNVMMLTNLAYVLQSEEFDKVLDHYVEIAGKNFYMYPRYQEGSKAGNLNLTSFTEEQISCDFHNPETRKYFYDVMGVRNNTTGGKYGPIPAFNFIEEPSTWQGRSMVGGTWYNNQLKLGTGVKVTMNKDHSDYHQGRILTPVTVHEMGHLFGFQHFSSFCNGEAADTGERVFYSLIQLMGAAGKLPYYDELPPYPVERCGFNKLEKFIYEHEDEFKDLHDYIESVKAKRNANYDRIVPEIKKIESLPAILRQVMGVTNNIPVNNFHVQDGETYAIFANTSCFYRL